MLLNLVRGRGPHLPVLNLWRCPGRVWELQKMQFYKEREEKLYRGASPATTRQSPVAMWRPNVKDAVVSTARP